MSLLAVLESLHESPEYERCLAALRADRAPVWIEGLAGVSKTFLAASLAQQLRTLLPQIRKIAAPQAQATGSFLERLQANAGKLVHISPVNAPAGDDASDVLARLEVESAHNDIAAAAADIGKLPEAAQAPAKDWLARVKARAAALAAADDLAADTARALTPVAR